MRVIVEIVMGARPLAFLLEIAKGMVDEGLTVSLASRDARAQVASCTRQATKYANWYGMRVDTSSSNIVVVMIRRLGELAVKAGMLGFLIIREL